MLGSLQPRRYEGLEALTSKRFNACRVSEVEELLVRCSSLGGSWGDLERLGAVLGTLDRLGLS